LQTVPATQRPQCPKTSGQAFLAKAGLIVLITFAAYLPALRGGFVFDDYPLITENGMVRADNGIRLFWSGAGAADYYPLTGSLWWLEWRWWGEHAAGYHVLDVLLHAVDAVLVWLILQRLNIPGAWLAALVFAIHPVNVATAGWISEQKNTLSMLFYDVAILLYLRFDEKDRWDLYALSLGAFLLALFSKTAVVMLPFVLLGCVWWLHGRLRWKDWLRSVPLFALSLIFGLVTVWFQYHRVLKGTTFLAGGFVSRLATAGCVVWFYLGKVLWPVNLSVVYPKWSVDPSRWTSWLPLLLLAGCVALSWLRRKTWGGGWLFGMGYFVVTLFPVMGFFDQGFYDYSLVADHWQYYSMIGIIALVVSAGVALGRSFGDRGKTVGVLVSATAVVALGAGTWVRAGVYATSETLWRDTVTKNSEAWMAQYNLGLALGKAGKIDDAITCFQQGVRLKPDFAQVHNYLGSALMQAGRVPEAIEQYRQALRIKPDYMDAQINLEQALSRESSGGN
jgi:tetratricopeptide (TPR) repeat protein